MLKNATELSEFLTCLTFTVKTMMWPVNAAALKTYSDLKNRTYFCVHYLE